MPSLCGFDKFILAVGDKKPTLIFGQKVEIIGRLGFLYKFQSVMCDFGINTIKISKTIMVLAC